MNELQITDRTDAAQEPETGEGASRKTVHAPVRRALILANPKAGRLSRQNLRETLRRKFEWLFDSDAHKIERGILPPALPYLAEVAAEIGLPADVEPIVPYAQLPERIALAQKEGYDTLVVAGGDGTVRTVAQALAGSEMRLGILPVGTANNFAHALRIPFVLEDALRVIAAGMERRIDAGKVEEKFFSGKRRYRAVRRRNGAARQRGTPALSD